MTAPIQDYNIVITPKMSWDVKMNVVVSNKQKKLLGAGLIESRQNEYQLLN